MAKGTRHLEYGTRESLRANIEKLTAAGYTQAKSRETRQGKQFFFGPDIPPDTHQYYFGLDRITPPPPSDDRYILVWDSDD